MRLIEIKRLACRRHEVVTIFVGAPPHTGGAMGSSSGGMDLLRLRRIARR